MSLNTCVWKMIEIMIFKIGQEREKPKVNNNAQN